MKNDRQIIQNTGQFILVPAGILVSGLCWFLSCGLRGDFWYLLWIAPVPVLLISYNLSGKKVFMIAFISYLIGRLSWISYLVSVLSLAPALIFTLALPAIYSLIIIINRSIVLKSKSWISVFAYPVIFTAYEFLLTSFSPDGSAASIAYSQSDFIPVIQIASVTGILGITFLVSFAPSVVALAYQLRNYKMKLFCILLSGGCILFSAAIYGFVRINNHNSGNAIKAGLVILDEKSHRITDNPELSYEKSIAERYVSEISGLAGNGAVLILLPERAVNLSRETDTVIINILANSARQNKVCIITGYTNFRGDKERNSGLVINSEGKVVTDYNKVHLIKGLESQFMPGKETGLFKFGTKDLGIAICKDLDFPGYIREYGKMKISVLCIPAWDFVSDGWLHSRMAVLRGVENGFSEIRTARKGTLTISDNYGRVNFEADGSSSQRTTLLGFVSLQNINTIYTHLGNWFGFLNLITAILFIVRQTGIYRISTIFKREINH